VLLHERVWILTVRQRDDADCSALPEQLVSGAESRLQTRPVAVVEEEDILRQLSERGRLPLRKSGAHWSDDGSHTGSHQPHDVKISFDDKDVIFAPDVVLGPVEPVKRLPLREGGRLW